MAELRYKYRWFVNDVRVYPTYPEGLSKQYSKEADRVFFREKINGVLTFLRAEFEPIWNVTLDNLFVLRVQREVYGVWTNYCTGEFYKTDAGFDVDNKIIRLQVKSVDKYEKILSAIDREFDVVRELLPSKHRVKYTKQGLTQVAFPGHANLFNIIGDSTYVTQTAGPLASELVDDFGFVQGQRLLYIPGAGDMIPDVSGFYEHDTASGVEIDRWVRNDGVYRLVGFNAGLFNPPGSTQWRIIRQSDDEDVYRTVYNVASSTYSLFPGEDVAFEGSYTFFAVINGGANQCRAFYYTPYMRILTDQPTVQGNATLPYQPGLGDFNYLYQVDPSFYIADEFNFPNGFGVIQPEDNHTTIPQLFGRYIINALHWPDQYFNPDLISGATKYYPCLAESWLEYSMTFHLTLAQMGLVAACEIEDTINDAYKLHEVIKLMLAQIDTAIGYEGDISHSQFLYNAVNPLTGDANPYTIFITPKTNLLVRDYDRADPTEKLTFGQIEQFFNNAPNIHFYIDSNSQMRWEHIQYYKNGRSYTGQNIVENLTAQIDPRLQKPWGYHSNRYGYKKETLPEFIKMTWPDEVSDVFKGTQIKAVAGFVNKGNTDTKPISAFITDIDFAVAFPTEVSNEGFALFSASMVDDDWKIPMIDIVIAGLPTLRIQNGMWSMRYLHDKYWRYNCPALDMVINGLDVEAESVKRARPQNWLLPSPIEPDPMLLIQTSVGVGEVEAMDVNFTTRVNKLGLLHDLDFDAPG